MNSVPAVALGPRRLYPARSAVSVVRSFRRLRVLVIGEAPSDRYSTEIPSGDRADRIISEAKGTTHPGLVAGLKALGADVTALSYLAQLELVLPDCDLVVVNDRDNHVSDAVLARLHLLREEYACALVVETRTIHRFRETRPTLLVLSCDDALRTANSPRASDSLTSIPGIEQSGRRILHSTNAESVAMELDARNILLIDSSRTAHLAIHSHSTHHAAAGPSFTAATALALGAGATPERAARIGVDAVEIAVTRRSSGPVTQHELMQRASLNDAPAETANLPERLAQARREGKTIAFTNGVFDVLHAGHVALLREAKKLADVLVVGVNSDSSLHRFRNGHQPTVRERHRLGLIASLDAVDHAVLFDEETADSLIHTVQPQLYVKGSDHAAEHLPEAAAVRALGGHVVILPLLEQVELGTMSERVARFVQG